MCRVCVGYVSNSFKVLGISGSVVAVTYEGSPSTSATFISLYLFGGSSNNSELPMDAVSSPHRRKKTLCRNRLKYHIHLKLIQIHQRSAWRCCLVSRILLERPKLRVAIVGPHVCVTDISGTVSYKNGLCVAMMKYQCCNSSEAWPCARHP